MPVQTQIQVRRSTAATWTSTNPTLAAGEIGFETDTGLFKIGNGVLTWTSLTYGAIKTLVASTGLTGGTINGTGTVAIDTAVTADLTTPQILSNKTLSYPIESTFQTATGFAGYTYYAITNDTVQYITANSTANGTLNITATASTTLNSVMAVDQSITCVLLVTNGATAYYPTAFQIDGSAITPKWSGGTAPTFGNPSSIDGYTFTIIKTASATFTVLAGQARFA